MWFLIEGEARERPNDYFVFDSSLKTTYLSKNYFHHFILYYLKREINEKICQKVILKNIPKDNLWSVQKHVVVL